MNYYFIKDVMAKKKYLDKEIKRSCARINISASSLCNRESLL